jgi:hypothetical protein
MEFAMAKDRRSGIFSLLIHGRKPQLNSSESEVPATPQVNIRLGLEASEISVVTGTLRKIADMIDKHGLSMFDA